MHEFRNFVTQDWPVNNSHLARVTLAVFRLGQLANKHHHGQRVCKALDFLWSRLLMGADLPPDVQAGPRLSLPHGGRGVVLHPLTRIGADVTIYHRVTLGRLDPMDAAPEIGDLVYIGTGAVILGGVVVGDRARVGANAVVLVDVPAGGIAVGVPALVKNAE